MVLHGMRMVLHGMRMVPFMDLITKIQNEIINNIFFDFGVE